VASAEFKGLNAVLHVITAEAAGENRDAEIEARLAVRGVADLGYQVHSDPEHKLLLRGSDGAVSAAYVIEKFDPTSMNSKTSVPYAKYDMVQPALTVIKRGGEIQQVWTWSTGVLKTLFDADPSMKVDALQKIPGYGLLVGVRPETADVLASIKENRDVTLQFQGLRRIVSEKIGCVIL